ncbi:hypothetical protein D3C87_1782440 [compost metagenome]
MSVIKSRSHLFRHIDNLFDSELSIGSFKLVQNLAKVATFHIFHDQEELTAFNPEIVNGNHVPVIQVHGDLGFFFEHLDELLMIRVLRKDALDTHKLIDAHSTCRSGQINFGHPTGSKLFKKNVLTKLLSRSH